MKIFSRKPGSAFNSRLPGCQALLLAVLTIATAQAYAGASQAVVISLMKERAQKASEVTTSPQVCPPAGYVKAFSAGNDPATSVIEGETRYCVPSEIVYGKRRTCLKYLPAEDFIKLTTGQADAVYSGMGLQGYPVETVVLFYCLPRKR